MFLHWDCQLQPKTWHTFIDQIPRKAGTVREVPDKVLQETGDMVELFTHGFAPDTHLYGPQVEVVGEWVNMSEVLEPVTLVCEDHR